MKYIVTLPNGAAAVRWLCVKFYEKQESICPQINSEGMFGSPYKINATRPIVIGLGH